MSLLIKNGHILDPQTGRDGIFDVLVQGDRIEKIAEVIEDENSEVIDAEGCYVMPGFIDLHVHLRDPGLEYKETLETGGKAAVRGGVTSVVAMPNTKPVIDSRVRFSDVKRRAEKESLTHVYQLGSVTVGMEGKVLSDISGMAQAGCIGISEDGKSVMDASLYRKGMKIAKEEGMIVFAHCEDITMVEGGVMNADENAETLGLPGITNSVEDVIVARDILLSKETGTQLHLCHCSTEDSVKMLRAAKKEGIPVSGEVCPHHFILTSDDIPCDDGNYKMNPPLRKQSDVDALIQGLVDGTMDVISTDHAPHAEIEKNRSMKLAAFGIVGIETSAALTYTYLVDKGILTPMQMVEKMSSNPAKILGFTDKGSVSEGKIADLVVFDPRKEYKIDKETFFSKGKNSPFDGFDVKGEVECTIVDGRVVFKGGQIID